MKDTEIRRKAFRNRLGAKREENKISRVNAPYSPPPPRLSRGRSSSRKVPLTDSGLRLKLQRFDFHKDRQATVSIPLLGYIGLRERRVSTWIARNGRTVTAVDCFCCCCCCCCCRTVFLLVAGLQVRRRGLGVPLNPPASHLSRAVATRSGRNAHWRRQRKKTIGAVPPPPRPHLFRFQCHFILFAFTVFQSGFVSSLSSSNTKLTFDYFK